MNIKFRTVTWYSQILAIVLALAILILGFYLGMSYCEQTESTVLTGNVSVLERTSELDVLPEVIDIPFKQPLLLSGIIETSDLMAEDGWIAIRLDAESMKAIPQIAQSFTEYKYMMFSNTNPLITKLASGLTNGTKVRFELSSYHFDRRGVDAHDSGILVSIEQVNQ